MPARRLPKRTASSGKIGIIRGFPPTPPPPPPPASFPNMRSSGLFTMPRPGKYIDWAVINGGIIGHWIRVTVYKCPVGAAKIAIAGPTSVFVEATFTAHETVATSGGKPDRTSVYYEVVVEDEDMRMHPSVQLFKRYPGDVIAGTLIPPQDFAQTAT
ncbi:MAG TPA: hypothetical protein VLL54_21635 [Pyrinomonadaceae bacterium]|nr:hypothetical protein [Pyrinomonadaceae bacterium]